MLNRNLLVWGSIITVVLLLCTGAFFLGGYSYKEHQRATRVQEIKSLMLEEGITDAYFIQLGCELAHIAK